jgi:hypothetical protein
VPQDSLWAASARPIGLTMQYLVNETGSVDRHELLIVPRYSKTPHGRDGTVGLVLPSYAVWHAPDIIRAAFYQYLGGDPKQVGAVAQSKLRDVLHEFQEGVRS